MQIKFIDREIEYTGKELHSLFAYQNFDLQGDSTVAFIGPCYVGLTDLVDQADVKEKAFIKSEKMVHFISEKFVLDLNEAIYRQRLYISIIKEVLEELTPQPRKGSAAPLIKGSKIKRFGDDLFIDDRKLSVSIATLSPVSSLIHIGVNVSSENTPVPAIGLADLGLTAADFAVAVLEKIESEEEGIINARSKVRGVN